MKENWIEYYLCLKKNNPSNFSLVDSVHRFVFDHRQCPEQPVNFFLSLRLSQHQSLIEKYQEIKTEILKTNPLLETAFVPSTSLHMTFFVVALPCWKDFKDFCHFLSQWLQQSSCSLPKSVTLNGLSNFGDRVVYFRLAEENVFVELFQNFLSNFRPSLPTLFCEKTLSPHITLMKTSRSKLKKIPKESWQTFENFPIGTFSVDSLELSSISEKDPDLFYAQYGILDFQNRHFSMTKPFHSSNFVFYYLFLNQL